MKYLFLLALTVGLLQCRPTTPAVTLTRPDPTQWRGHTYRIISGTLADSVTVAPSALRLTWPEEGRHCQLQLSVNRCSMTYEADDHKVYFGEGACTEACCDTPDEMKLLQQLGGHTWQYVMTDRRIELFQRTPLQRIVLERTSTRPDRPE